MNALLLLADGLLALGGISLLVLVAPARPVRPEGLVGLHLITAPIALALTAAVACVWFAAPRPWPWAWANVLLPCSLPGLAVVVTVLPFAAFQRRGAALAKLGAVAVVLAMAAFAHGNAIAAGVAPAAAGLLAAFGLAGSCGIAAPLWQFVRRRLPCRLHLGRRAAPPSAWQLAEAAAQRAQWAEAAAHADVPTLLAFARSFAPEVRQQCLDRLARRPDLAVALAGCLRGPEPGDALHYVRHDYPRSRAELGPMVAAMLAARLGSASAPTDFLTFAALDCGIAVLRDGGDVRHELAAWQQRLQARPESAAAAKALRRALRRA